MSRKQYPSDISDEEWSFVAPYLTLVKEGSPQRQHDLRDSYDFQSYARIELWSEPEGKWNYVHNIPYPEMACVQSALGGKMEEDARELLRMALLIIE